MDVPGELRQQKRALIEGWLRDAWDMEPLPDEHGTWVIRATYRGDKRIVVVSESIDHPDVILVRLVAETGRAGKTRQRYSGSAGGFPPGVEGPLGTWRSPCRRPAPGSGPSPPPHRVHEAVAWRVEEGRVSSECGSCIGRPHGTQLG